MDYYEFFFDSLSIILQPFQQYTSKDYTNILKNKYEQIITSRKSIYVEIFAHSNNVRTKIQQWKFKPKSETINSNLQRSLSQENGDNDSELSFSEINQPNFFKILENIRKNIQPKLLLKNMDNPKVTCQIKDSENKLIAFQNQNTFYFEVSQYENQLFVVKLSFKYNYEDEVVAQQLIQLKNIKESDSDDFELLIDQSYQRQIKKTQNQDKIKENSMKQINSPLKKQTQRKNCENTVYSNKVLNQKSQITQSKSNINSKREAEFQQIQKLFKNIDFTTIESTKLKNFLEYLL